MNLGLNWRSLGMALRYDVHALGILYIESHTDRHFVMTKY